MSWCEKLDKIDDDLNHGRMLLSSALLLTATVMRGVAHDTVLQWLNRELTGYEEEDFNRMKRSGFAPLLSPRNITGILAEEKGGVVVERGTAGVVIAHGISEIEGTLDSLFDISIFEKGDYHLMVETLDRSPLNLANVRLPLPEQDAAMYFTVLNLLNVYFGVMKLLREMIQTLKQCYTGAELIRHPNIQEVYANQ